MTMVLRGSHRWREHDNVYVSQGSLVSLGLLIIILKDVEDSLARERFLWGSSRVAVVSLTWGIIQCIVGFCMYQVVQILCTRYCLYVNAGEQKSPRTDIQDSRSYESRTRLMHILLLCTFSLTISRAIRLPGRTYRYVKHKRRKIRNFETDPTTDIYVSVDFILRKSSKNLPIANSPNSFLLS